MGKRFLIYLVVAVGTIAAVAILFNLFMTVFVGGRQVTVPDVRGLREENAIAMLRADGLRYEILGDEFSVEYPESTISSQNPEAGHVVKQGRKILVMISKGGEFRDVPYCLGKPLRTAQIILERAGLIVGNISRVSSARSYPEEVLSTEPLVGSKVVRGTPVNILVSEGTRKARMLMPSLKEKSYLAVKIRLEQLGFFVQESSLDEKFNPLRSQVVLQKPAAGHVVASGDTVTLIISSASEDTRSF